MVVSSLILRDVSPASGVNAFLGFATPGQGTLLLDFFVFRPVADASAVGAASGRPIITLNTLNSLGIRLPSAAFLARS
jgi:hypothetical protein